MIIPSDMIPTELLEGIIVEYIFTANGNDHDDTPLSTKINHVKSALRQGDLLVSYSELHESVSLRPASDYQNT